MAGSSLWHPNTQMSEWDGFPRITGARGVWLTDSGGRRMMDAVASMWCNVWGHSDPQLAGAISAQLERLQHVPLFNLTHGPAEDLARRLVKMSPGMDRTFLSDNGSSAMEVAVKLALQYWQNEGEKGRTAIASLEGGYHGDTFGAMSVGYVPEFFGRFRSKLFGAARLPVPRAGRQPGGATLRDRQAECLERAEARLARGDVAALVMESGAQLAAGAVIYPRGFQRELGRICRRHGTLLVLDEIATGLGRLGSMVQYAEQDCRPDIVSYGKMLTGGYLTMAATLATGRVYRSFLGGFEEQRHLFHGHTYTGNPLAAAAAVENLKMYRQRGLIRQIRKTSGVFAEHKAGLEGTGGVAEVRHAGMLMGIELACSGARAPGGASLNRIFFEEGRRQGVYLRTLGNTVMLVPPLAITPDELDLLLVRAARTIRAAAPRALKG